MKHLLPKVPGLRGLPGLPKLDLPRLRVPAIQLPTVGSRGYSGRPDPLALREVCGNLTITASAVTVWFTLAGQHWPFVSDAKRAARLHAMAIAYAKLAGRHLHLRRTSVPLPVADWAWTLENNSAPLPDAAGAPTFHDHLNSARHALVAGRHVINRTHLGVSIPRPARLFRRGSDTLDENTLKDIAEITEDLRMGGLAARPTTPAELAWLIYRSVGIGVDPPKHHPGDVEPDDIAEFADAISMARDRYDRTTQVINRYTGQVAHVAVLTLGRTPPLNIPDDHLPWAHLSERAEYPVEFSSRVDILTPAQSRRAVEMRLRVIRNQVRDYDEHDLPAPPELERLAGRATRIGDQMDTALPVDANRAHGYHRFAVAGDTEQECEERVRDLIRLYQREAANTTLTRPPGQVRLLREFIPGQPVANDGYLRRMPVRMFAAAVPQATAAVGDTRGDLIGVTAPDAARPVFMDLHYPMEVRARSGLTVVVGEPGGGKSTLIGAFGYLNARRGVQVTLLDPSGPLAALCDMPEMRPHSRVIDLARSTGGILAPYSLVPTPRRGDFPDGPAGDAEWADAAAMAEAERLALVQDIATMLLVAGKLIPNAAVGAALRKALQKTAAAEDTTLQDLIDNLYILAQKGDAPTAQDVAEALEHVARLPMAKPFFGSPPPGAHDTTAAFTVITMAGLRLPDLTSDPSQWNVQEALAVPTLYTAQWLAAARCYSGSRDRRKLLGLDEAHFMQHWASGRQFLDRLVRDSRKWNLAALLASQNPRDILGLDLENLISTVFVGRLADDEQVAGEALRLLRTPVNAGYESVLAGLSQVIDTTSDAPLGYREFLVYDVDKRCQKIIVDVSYVPGLLDALNTNPGGPQ